MEVVSIFLGALLILGLFVLPKGEIENITDPKIKIALRGAIFLRKLLLPIFALILIGAGLYYYNEKRKEDAIKKEQEDKRVTLSKLVNIASTVHHEKETEIFKLDFVASGPNEFGATYSRNGDNEIIEKFETGVIRYITKINSNYIQVRDALKDSEYKFGGESPNNVGDMISEYSKGDISISAGVFASTQQYLIAVTDNRTLVQPKNIIEENELIGKWGRNNGSKSGSIVFGKGNTFNFVHHESGSIQGKWVLEGKELTMHYNEGTDKRFSYTRIPHPFSSATEIIFLQGRDGNQLNGYIKGGYKDNIALIKMN